MAATSNYSPSLPSLESSLDECRQLFDLGVRSNFNEAIEKLKQWSSQSIYYGAAEIGLLTIRAILTMEKDDVQETIAVAESLIELSDKFLKTRPKSRGFFRKVEYKNFTDDQAHALLTKAMATNVLAVMTMINDNKLMALVKAVLRIQSGHAMLKECTDIMIEKKDWTSDIANAYHIDLVQLCDSSLVLCLSHMPERIMSFLSWFGFSTDRDKAMEITYLLCEHGTSFTSTSGKIGLCMYECVIVPVLGARQVNVNKLLQITEKELNNYSQSSWALLFKAMALKHSSDFDNAIDYYNRCLESNDSLKQLHNLCHWDLTFCYGLKMDWDLAAKHAGHLFDQCNWSRATFVYMKAAFLYMKMIDENKPELKDEVSELFRRVPSLKQRFAGKTIPPEKYVCVNADKYLANNESLPLPAFDLFYIWNVYSLSINNSVILNRIINRVEKALQDYSSDDQIENYCLLQLTKVVCLKYQQKNEEAENCLQLILTNEGNLSTHLLAMSSLEMGLIKINTGDYQEADVWLKRAQNYRKYFFKMLIHFRVHSALQQINEMKNRNSISG